MYDAIKIEGKIEVVLVLNEDKTPIPQICKYVNLTEKEVIKILKDNGKL